MKKLFSLLLLIPSLVFAQADSARQFVITGKITGLADGEVKVMTTQNDPVIVAQDSVRNGQFQLKGSIPEPGLYFLVMGAEQPQYIYLENAPINVTGEQANIKGLKIEGSSSHLDFIELNRIFNPMMAELGALSAQIQQESNEKKRTAFFQQYDSVLKRVHAEVGSFISNRRSSYVAPFLLWVTSQITPDILVMEQHFNLLDSNIRNTQIAKSLGEYIAYHKVGAVGTDAVDFTQNDTSGNAVSLSSFKGKYVLVDFWASWCGPCRKENPNVVKTYNKYKDKNFTVLGVSLDQQKEAWVKAIQKDELKWTQVSDLQYWDNAAAKLYRISSIPGNFLMDPSGKIIAKDLRGEALEQTLAQYLGAVPDPAPKKQATPAKKTTPVKKGYQPAVKKSPAKPSVKK